MPAAERPAAGARINEAKAALEAALDARRDELADAKLARAARRRSARRLAAGSRHRRRRRCIRSRARIERIETLFHSLGFAVADGPEIEDDFHNFTALNTPEDHPARSMHDTFYVDGGMVLRTHTSPIQVRYMETHAPPIKIIAPGPRVSRRQRRHAFADVPPGRGPVDRRGRRPSPISRACSPNSCAASSSATICKVRFRPSFFPFTEPSAEIDMSFGDGWLEISGAGQVHPNVLRAVGIDPERYQGFAFGMGPDRLAMLRYGVDDLRLFYENDLRFLRQFA